MTVTTEVKDDTKVTQPDTKIQQEKPDQKQTSQNETQKPPEETQEQINWRKFRQEREKERKAKEESDRRAAEKTAEAEALKLAMESLLNKPVHSKSSQASGEYADSVEESEDDRIDKKVQAALKGERERNEVERRKQEIADLPKKLASTFNDFNQVCNQENLDYLEYHYPEVAQGFKHAPETFETWAAFYKALKRFVPNLDGKKEEKRIEKNLNKPQSMSLPGVSQTGDESPSMLTDKRRQDNWSRMQRTLKGVK